MKFFVLAPAFALITAAHAQKAPTVAGPLVGVPIVTQPGQFDIKQTDTSGYVRDLVKQIEGVQQSDIKYIEDTIRALNEATNEYTRLLTSGEFRQMANDSQSGKHVPVERFLEVQAKVIDAKQRLQNKMALLTSISGALPSDAVIGEGRTNQQIFTPRRIDFSKTIAAVNAAIENAENVAKNYGFVIEHKEGLQVVTVNSGTALNVQLNFPLLTSEAIAQLQRKAQVLSTPSAKFDEELTESHARLLKRLIATFVSAYGKEEAYRFRDEALAAARSQAFEQIVTAFWQRSYLRYVYGVRVGTILPANYQKRYANIDAFTVLMDQLGTFKSQSGPSQVSDDDLLRAVEDVRQKLMVLDARSAKIMSGDASVLARVNSFITLLKGERPTAEALLLIMQLIAADIKEEQMLATGMGLDPLISFYEQRWQATDADVGVEQQRVCAFDHINNVKNPKPDCYFGGASGGLKGEFTAMNDELNANSSAIDNALKIRDQIRLAQLAQSMSGQGNASGASGRRGGGRR